jgi:hypothetical protein
MDLGLPDKLELHHRGSGIEIVRRWLGWQTVFLTAFAVFWCGFLFFWYSIALPMGNTIMTLFPLIHVAVGVGLAYRALAGWVNTTRITVDQGRLSVRHGPLPWLGNKDLDASNLKQLYSGRNSTTVTYEVRVITSNGRNEKVVSGLESSEQALYVEQEIERYFRIENAPVRGEIGD